MATNFTMYRYAGETTGWVELHPKTNADQVNQTETRVFLHPTTNKINGKAFGSIVSNVWTPSAITLYGTDITLTNAQGSSTITSAIADLQDNGVVTDAQSFSGGEIIVGDTASGAPDHSVEGSGIYIQTKGTSTWSSVTTNRDTKVPTMAMVDTWTGSNTVTTVGTIGTGTWHGTAVGLAYGGTGATNASDARTNLGLGDAATYGVATTKAEIEGAAQGSTKLTTAYAVQQYVADISITYTTVWDRADYQNETAPTDDKLRTIPYGVKVKYDGGDSEATGLLSAGASQKNKVLLIYSPNSEGDDAYDEYLCVVQGSSYVWERIGSTSVDLSNYVQADNTLTADKVILGNGDKKVYASSYGITSSVSSDLGYLITSSGVNSYLANSYEGSTHIKTLGTIKTGTWEGTAIAATYVGDLPSSKITTMTGYSEPQSSGAIATTDSLNQAIGKLERKADTNSTNIGNLIARAQIFWADNTSDVTGMKTGDFAFIY